MISFVKRRVRETKDLFDYEKESQGAKVEQCGNVCCGSLLYFCEKEKETKDWKKCAKVEEWEVTV